MIRLHTHESVQVHQWPSLLCKIVSYHKVTSCRFADLGGKWWKEKETPLRQRLVKQFINGCLESSFFCERSQLFFSFRWGNMMWSNMSLISQDKSTKATCYWINQRAQHRVVLKVYFLRWVDLSALAMCRSETFCWSQIRFVGIWSHDRPLLSALILHRSFCAYLQTGQFFQGRLLVIKENNYQCLQYIHSKNVCHRLE